MQKENDDNVGPDKVIASDQTLERADAVNRTLSEMETTADQRAALNTDTLRQNVKREHPNKSLAKWFWGTIIVLALATASLALLAHYQNSLPQSAQSDLAQAAKPSVTSNATLPKELSPSTIRATFNKANAAAIKITSSQVEQLVEAAFEPVYKAIPIYTDWHYSVWGSYVELGNAAIGDPERQLQERVLIGLEQRLNKTSVILDGMFEKEFKSTLKVEFGSLVTAGATAGPLTKKIYNDAAKQTASTAVILASGAASKPLAAAMLKTIGTKVVAKGATKGAAVLTGLGGGGLLCAWAGPGAAACAVVGGATAWFTFDVVVNKLDELISREEFEKFLREEITKSKRKQIEFMKTQLELKATNRRTQIDGTLQTFTLKQLSEFDLQSVCLVMTDLISSYDQIKNNLAERSENNLINLMEQTEASSKKLGLFEISQEILNNLTNSDNAVYVVPNYLNGILPENFAKRAISGSFEINGRKYGIKKQDVTDKGNLNLQITNSENHAPIKMLTASRAKISIDLEQHLILSNNYFRGVMALDKTEFVEKNMKSALSVPFGLIDRKSGGWANVEFPSFNLKLLASVEGNHLPSLKLIPPDCKN